MSEKKISNPKGRGGFGDNPQNINRKGPPPKEKSWAGLLREAYDKVKNGDQRPKKEIIAERLINLAMEGELGAIKMIMDRVDGLPTAKVENKNENRLIIDEEVVE